MDYSKDIRSQFLVIASALILICFNSLECKASSQPPEEGESSTASTPLTKKAKLKHTTLEEPVAAATASSSQAAAASSTLPSNVSSSSSQTDEGWRWKSSLEFTYKEFSTLNPAFGFSVDLFHKEMAEREYNISAHLPEGVRKNILLSAFSIVLRKGDSWRIVGDYFRYGRHGQPYSLSPVRVLESGRTSDIGTPPSLACYCIQSGKTLGFSGQIEQELTKALAGIRTPTGHSIDIKEIKEHWNHTELFLHLYLARNNFLSTVLSKILEENQVTAEETIEEIVLHLHSRLDICKTCAQSLYWLGAKPDGVISKCTEELQASGYQVTKDPSDGSKLKLLILASSREIYTKENRRWGSGHDDQYLAQIDGRALPPYFAVKAIEPFLFSSHKPLPSK